MHELSIAQGIVDQVVALARKHVATRVSGVTVVVGATRLVVPESLQLAFEAAAQGTSADGAELRIVEQPTQATCNHCGRSFQPPVDCYVCPGCGRASVLWYVEPGRKASAWCAHQNSCGWFGPLTTWENT